MATGEPVIVEDYATNPRLVARPLYAAREVQLKSGMAAPLSIGQRRKGVLYVLNRETTVFDASDAEMLLALANQATIAIENARLYAKLQEAALTDALTGLRNSRYLHERLYSEIVRAARYGGKLALLIADCDSPKEMNDRFGYPIGDRLVAELGRLIRNNMREGDVVTRYGGNEFVILLPKADVFAAQQAAERIRGKVAYTQLDVDGLQLIITISIGIVVYPDDATSAEDLLRKADSALSRAKSQGKNKVCTVEPAL